MHTTQVPVLSTAHIRPDTGAFLTDEGNDRLGAVATYEGGWFIFIGDPMDLDAYEALSEDLQKVLQWASDNAYEWIRIDGIGDIVEGLPNYSDDWW